jgi:hypothetical protein
MNQEKWIKALISEQAVQANPVNRVTIDEKTITIELSATMAPSYERADCRQPVRVKVHDSEVVTVQGLGIQGKALRYQVKRTRVAYVNDAGEFVTFTLPISGIRTDILVSNEVVEKVLYLNVDRNLSLQTTVEMLHDLYQVESSDSALERWKQQAAAALPCVGQLIQQLHQKKR